MKSGIFGYVNAGIVVRISFTSLILPSSGRGRKTYWQRNGAMWRHKRSAQSHELELNYSFNHQNLSLFWFSWSWSDNAWTYDSKTSFIYLSCTLKLTLAFLTKSHNWANHARGWVADTLNFLRVTRTNWPAYEHVTWPSLRSVRWACWTGGRIWAWHCTADVADGSVFCTRLRTTGQHQPRSCAVLDKRALSRSSKCII